MAAASARRWRVRERERLTSPNEPDQRGPTCDWPRRGPITRRRSNSGGGEFVAVLLGLAVVVIIVMSPLSLWGHAIHLTPSSRSATSASDPQRYAAISVTKAARAF